MKILHVYKLAFSCSFSLFFIYFLFYFLLFTRRRLLYTTNNIHDHYRIFYRLPSPPPIKIYTWVVYDFLYINPYANI
jgi:hypothetical protein